MSHSPVGRLTPWTFGYKPGTKSTCLVCDGPVVYVFGAKRHYWRHEKPAA